MPHESLHCALPFPQRKGAPRDAPTSCQVQSAQRTVRPERLRPDLGGQLHADPTSSSPPSRGAAEEEMAICRCRHLSASALRHLGLPRQRRPLGADGSLRAEAEPRPSEPPVLVVARLVALPCEPRPLAPHGVSGSEQPGESMEWSNVVASSRRLATQNSRPCHVWPCVLSSVPPRRRGLSTSAKTRAPCNVGRREWY
jgi:hypothetical protein